MPLYGSLALDGIAGAGRPGTAPNLSSTKEKAAARAAFFSLAGCYSLPLSSR